MPECNMLANNIYKHCTNKKVKPIFTIITPKEFSQLLQRDFSWGNCKCALYYFTSSVW